MFLNGFKHSSETKRLLSECRKGAGNPSYGKTSSKKGKTYEELYGPEKTKKIKEKIIKGLEGKSPCNNTNLTIEDVLNIRNILKIKTKTKRLILELTKKYNVSEITIYRIHKRKTWKHI